MTEQFSCEMRHVIISNECNFADDWNCEPKNKIARIFFYSTAYASIGFVISAYWLNIHWIQTIQSDEQSNRKITFDSRFFFLFVLCDLSYAVYECSMGAKGWDMWNGYLNLLCHSRFVSISNVYFICLEIFSTKRYMYNRQLDGGIAIRIAIQ